MLTPLGRYGVIDFPFNFCQIQKYLPICMIMVIYQHPPSCSKKALTLTALIVEWCMFLHLRHEFPVPWPHYLEISTLKAGDPQTPLVYLV